MYDIKGHAIFTEKGDEAKNNFLRNLVVWVRVSWSLRNSDYTPSGIWIYNLDNNYVGNRVAGSEGHGIWLDMRKFLYNELQGTLCPSC